MHWDAMDAWLTANSNEFIHISTFKFPINNMTQGNDMSYINLKEWNWIDTMLLIYAG